MSDKKISVVDNKPHLVRSSASILGKAGYVIASASNGKDPLKVSEERFRRLAENSPDIITRFSFSPVPHFEYVSPASMVITGYTPEEYYADNELGAKLIHPEDKELRQSIMDRPDLYESIPVKMRYIRKDGRTIWVERRQISTRDEDGKLISLETIVRDVTESMRIEEALRVSEINFRNSIDNSPLGVRIVSTNGETIYANQRFLDIYGYENLEEFRSNSIQKRYTPESNREYLVRREKRQHSEVTPENYVISIVRKNGGIRHLEVFRKKVLWGGESQSQVLYNDVTEQKQTEEALKASEENFRNSLDNSPLGIRISSINNYTLYANQALLDIFGYKNIDEVNATRPQKYYTPQSYAEYLKMRALFRRSETMPDQMEIDIVRKDGAVRHLQALFKVILWDGKPQYQTLYNDITERKRAEEALKESEGRFRLLAEELKHQNEQLTEFLHNVTHELKTPLTAIIASIEMLISDEGHKISLEQRDLFLNNINRSAWMMDASVGDLLDLAKIQIGRLDLQLEPIDLRETIDDLSSQILPLFENKRQIVETVISGNLPFVKGDEKRTKQVILNFLSNANKYSPNEGHIGIFAREQDNMVRIEVKDTAATINEADRANIFQPYYRGGSAKEQQRVSGLGLGLAISKSLVVLMSGEIGVISEESHGNTFFFTLPIWKD
jgi:PAS domain S-box-containing protein